MKLMGEKSKAPGEEVVAASAGSPSQEARPKGTNNRVIYDQSQHPSPLKYNVTIPSVPQWKLSSVANFKRRAYLQNIQEQQRRVAMEKKASSGGESGTTGAPNDASSSAGGGRSGMGRRSSARQMINEAAAASSNSNNNGQEERPSSSGSSGSASGVPMDVHVPPEGFEIGVRLPDPMLGLSIANKSMLQSLSYDELKTEMEKMNFNCSLIKNELCALEKFRGSLVWLLRNSTMYKVQRHHNEEGLKAGSQGNPKKRHRSTTDSATSPVAKASKYSQ